MKRSLMRAFKITWVYGFMRLRSCFWTCGRLSWLIWRKFFAISILKSFWHYILRVGGFIPLFLKIGLQKSGFQKGALRFAGFRTVCPNIGPLEKMIHIKTDQLLNEALDWWGLLHKNSLWGEIWKNKVKIVTDYELVAHFARLLAYRARNGIVIYKNIEKITSDVSKHEGKCFPCFLSLVIWNEKRTNNFGYSWKNFSMDGPPKLSKEELKEARRKRKLRKQEKFKKKKQYKNVLHRPNVHFTDWGTNQGSADSGMKRKSVTVACKGMHAFSLLLSFFFFKFIETSL